MLSFSAQLGWGISINKLVCNQGFNAVVLAIRLPFTGRTLPVLLALYSGCTDFWRVLRPKMEKRGLWTIKGTKRGPQNSFWSPWGPKSPKGDQRGSSAYIQQWESVYWLVLYYTFVKQFARIAAFPLWRRMPSLPQRWEMASPSDCPVCQAGGEKQCPGVGSHLLPPSSYIYIYLPT